MIIWLIYMGLLLYWEVVYHIGSFGFVVSYPWIMLGLLSILAAVQTILTGIAGQKHKNAIFWAFSLVEYLVFAVQTVYYTIFRQPLQLRAMIVGGQDALSNYWREALMGILKASPVLVILALPLVAMGILFYRKEWQLPVLNSIQRIRVVFVFGVSFLVYWMALELGKTVHADYYYEYTEFYDPTIVMQDMGVIAMAQRDIGFEMEAVADEVLKALGWQKEIPESGELVAGNEGLTEDMAENNEAAGGSSDALSGNSGEDALAGVAGEKGPAGEEAGNVSGEEGGNQGTGGEVGNHGFDGEAGNQDPDRESSTGQEDILPEYNTIELDLTKLAELSAGDSEKEWLADYIANLEPTRTNEYTGLFKDYNLIYITAEGFSTYAINADLTPTLYKLANSGFVFTNYYVPLWQTSTSDGEYVNLTGLIPDGQFSMSKTQNNNMAYALPAFFNKEGCVNLAYHNNSLSYYERHLSHPNLGYDFKAAKLGELDEAEWGDKLFYMENPNKWPASDLEMVQSTVPEYIQAEQFNVYYMTVSGHMYYSFTGNSMSSKNKEAVANLDMSENARAYIACHIELDKALEHLLTELERAGKLENTVIALSADHYPYAMTEEQYEELAGKDLSGDRDIYRNSLILWNAGMEESVMVTKPCCSVDILPTLLNLLGYDYDSRMYAGRDILSDAEGLVIFNDRSFVTDTVIYDRKSKTTTWQKELSDAEKELYLDAMKQEVKERYNFSAYMLRQNYYDLLKQCEIE